MIVHHFIWAHHNCSKSNTTFYQFTQTLEDHSPYELFDDFSLDYSHYHVFGSTCFALLQNHQNHKLQPRSNLLFLTLWYVNKKVSTIKILSPNIFVSCNICWFGNIKCLIVSHIFICHFEYSPSFFTWFFSLVISLRQWYWCSNYILSWSWRTTN